MSGHRDPLSVDFDPFTHDLLMRAARASTDRRGVRAWVASPRAEFGRRDGSGRTVHERAFTRSAYHHVRSWDHLLSGTVEWSLQLTWGTDAERRASSAGRLARPVIVRMRPRAEAAVTGTSYISERRAGRSGGRDESA